MRLIDAPVGLFLWNGQMCLKTEYIADWGVEAYIVSSGETFWGGAKTAEERNNLDVTPIEAEPVRHGRWIHDINNLYGCSECLGRETMSHNNKKPYCPNCGAKMDGDSHA